MFERILQIIKKLDEFKSAENAGEWWKSDIEDVLTEFLSSGGDPNASDAFLVNGQPGLLYPCSGQGKPNGKQTHFAQSSQIILQDVILC